MEHAPLILFVYNRADHFLKTYEALKNNEGAGETELFVFADGAKDETGKAKVDECREAVRRATADGAFRSVNIAEAPANQGLAASVISGVTEVLEKYGSAIVLEDDCITAPSYLKFMNEALGVFADDKRVGAIAGFTPSIDFPADFGEDIFTCYRSCSCGWATWRDRWEGVDWELKDIGDFYKDLSLVKRLNENGSDRFLRLYRQVGGGSSWSVRFGAHLVKNGMLTVYPRYSLIENIGVDGTGVHGASEDAETVKVDLSKAISDPVIRFEEPDKRIARIMKKHYSGGFVSEAGRAVKTALILIKERLK